MQYQWWHRVMTGVSNASRQMGHSRSGTARHSTAQHTCHTSCWKQWHGGLPTKQHPAYLCPTHVLHNVTPRKRWHPKPLTRLPKPPSKPQTPPDMLQSSCTCSLPPAAAAAVAAALPPPKIAVAAAASAATAAVRATSAALASISRSEGSRRSLGVRRPPLQIL